MMPAIAAGIPSTALAPKTNLTSVLVAVIGPYPMDYYGTTTEASLLKMCANTPGVEANLIYIPDIVTAEEKATPYDHVCEDGWAPWAPGLVKMRESAVDQARAMGYDYVFVVENDAAVKSDTLGRLLKSPADIVCPRLDYITFPPVSRVCWGPQAPMGTTGYWPLKWCAFTALLISQKAMSLEPFWGESFLEGVVAERWLDSGLSLEMDLDTGIDVLKLPSGHKGYSKIPFGTHMRKVNGMNEECDGTMDEVFANQLVAVWVCSDGEHCGHALVFNTRFNK